MVWTKSIATHIGRHVVNGSRFGHTIVRATVWVHHFLAEVTFCQELIMGATHERNIICAAIATASMGIVMVVLEVFSRSAASSVLAYIGTTSSVARVHHTLYRCGNVARAWRRVRVLEALPRLFYLAKTFGLEPLELFRNGGFYDRSQIGPRHEGAESLELLVELGARGEVDSVARRGERLHNCRLHGSFTCYHPNWVSTQLGWRQRPGRFARCR